MIAPTKATYGGDDEERLDGPPLSCCALSPPGNAAD